MEGSYNENPKIRQDVQICIKMLGKEKSPLETYFWRKEEMDGKIYICRYECNLSLNLGRMVT